MTPQELRIGNYIQSLNFMFRPTPEWQEWKVTAEDLMNMESNDPENYKGIPLTEEWLLKFGFVRGGFSKKTSDSFYEIAVGASGLFINPDNGVVWIERGTNIFNNPALIEYVHQLQNLYFALTGEELTIKEI